MSILVITALVAGLTVQPVAGPERWTVDLGSPASSSRMSIVDPDTQILVYRPRTLRTPANRFTADVDGAAAVDVRGREPDGDWTEWTQAPAVLADPTAVVQVRVVFDGPRPTRLTMRADTAAAPLPPRTQAGLTYEIFATREGLVGGRTANGHIIVERDHFVALPTRRGLSMKDTGDYTVKVCATNGRCEWAPVWDVGPWNTRDDYWNPPDVRQMWTDLPQGRPQAQAAKLDGYNGGLDQFGRVVRNPAGIDLADGTFWDGLQLTNNSWVTVTFTWTGSGPVGTVRAGEPLNVRTGPGTDAPVVGLAADLAQIRVECHTAGERVDGTQGSTDLWYRLAPDRWVTAAYVAGATEAPAC
ncbi:MAG TPA: hypothetical protein VGX25_29550 [Actinophytocola sp.]|uniref:hypothetical protein n=1 Tax=Actinophytocola sp. TaxID=1872138 RepID=UPI002DDDB9B8|nr:hypothetical protein [Actinophytocola sp.]HEV2783551.1 hypothetical protein [Actinophytocola sp.]